MLVAPEFLWGHVGTVLIVTTVTIFVKAFATMGVERLSGYLAPTAIMTGLGMVQIGEFSFIIAQRATDLGIFGQDILSLAVVSAAVTMALTPGIMSGVSLALDALARRFTFLRGYRPNASVQDEGVPHMINHAIVCGLGRVGSLVEQALRAGFGGALRADDGDRTRPADRRGPPRKRRHRGARIQRQRHGSRSGARATREAHGDHDRRPDDHLLDRAARSRTQSGDRHRRASVLARRRGEAAGAGRAPGRVARHGGRTGDASPLAGPLQSRRPGDRRAARRHARRPQPRSRARMGRRVAPDDRRPSAQPDDGGQDEVAPA